MALRVIGDNIIFEDWLAATIAPTIGASERERFVRTLEEGDPRIDKLEKKLEQYEIENEGLEEQLREQDREISSLKALLQRINEMLIDSNLF